MIVFPALSSKDQDRLNDLIATNMTSDIDEGTNGDILAAYQSRFPRWTLLTQPDKCASTFRQLEEKALDLYKHIPSVLELFVLVRSLEDWLDFLEDEPTGPRNLDDNDLAKVLADKDQAMALRKYIKGVCPKPGILFNVEDLINNVLEGGQAYKDFGIKLEDYFDIVPPDIRQRLEVSLTAAPS